MIPEPATNWTKVPKIRINLYSNEQLPISMMEEGKIEGLQLQEGVVTKDGQEIDFEKGTPFWCGQKIINDLYLLRINVKFGVYLMIGLVWFFALISLYGYLAGNIGVHSAAALIPFSFLITIGAILFFRGTPVHPKEMAFKKKGIEVYYGSNRSYTISWDYIKDIRELPSTAPESKSYSIVWGKDNINMENTNITPMIADLLSESLARRKDVTFFFDVKSPTFNLWQIAPPGSKVLVSEKMLSSEEKAYRKIRGRFLDNGIFTPIYVSENEDLRIVKNYVKSDSLPLDELKTVGNLALEQGIWDISYEIWNHITSISPNDLKARTNVAGSLIKSKKFDEALKLLEEILSENPKSSDALFLQSIAFSELEDLEGAKYKVGLAFESDNNNIDALQLWFDLVAGESGFGQAIAEIDYLASTHENAWGPYYVLGFSNERAQNLKDAHDHYKKAIQINANETTIGAMASILIQMGKPNEVELLFKKYRDYLPPESPVLLAQAHAWLLQGITYKAKNLFRFLEQKNDYKLRFTIQEMKERFGIRD
jgi:tetratricopeptide (TPR) repeat protein